MLIILQARTTSSRLPNKILLDLGGMPFFVLAAKRAANTGLKLIVATSHNGDDDIVAQNCLKYGIDCYRGPLEDVLLRFILASRICQDDDTIVRLTADNCFPDGRFIESALKEFSAHEGCYLQSDMTQIPYGLSVEIFKRSDLTQANQFTESLADREHVTPWIRNNRRIIKFAPAEFKSFGVMRCTVDNSEDFRNVASALSELPAEQLVSSSALNFCQLLATKIEVEAKRFADKKFIMGGAQIGSNYGIFSRSKNSEVVDYFELLDFAVSRKVSSIDTAQGYPNSEEIISNFIKANHPTQFSVLTKVAPIDHSQPFDGQMALVQQKIETSLQKFPSDLLKVIMFHRFDDIDYARGAIVQFIKKNSGVRIGVSVQSPEELKKALQLDFIRHIQMPFNILDYRWIDDDLLSQLRGRDKSIKIHVRSLFLQGLIVADDPSQWPNISVPVNAAAICEKLKEVARGYGYTLHELAFSFIKSFPWIDGYVVGVDSKNQLSENLKAYHVPPMGEIEALHLVGQFKKLVPAELLNPAKWKK